MSGPSAIWGQSVQNGMNLALEDHPELAVTYEDSKGTAADGVTAYQKLKLQQPDVFVSALSIASRALVRIPLPILSNERAKKIQTGNTNMAIMGLEMALSI